MQTTQVAQATVIYQEAPTFDITALAISETKREVKDPVYDAALALFEKKLGEAEYYPTAVIRDERGEAIAVKTCRLGVPCDNNSCSSIVTIYKPTRR